MFRFLKRKSKDKTLPEKKDVMIGIWENDLDDGSGLHAIWGWSFKFNEDGTGTYYYWRESKLQHEIEFSWKRLSQKSIQAKYSTDDEWATIEYSIKIINAPYAGQLLKLTDNNYKRDEPGAEGFWGCVGAIYKNL